MFKKFFFPTLGLLIAVCSCVVHRNAALKPVKEENLVVKTDTTKKIANDSIKPGQLRPYREIITGKAITSKGLFTVHKINDKYYFEISDSLLNKSLLLVTRITRGPALGKSIDFGFPGDKIGESEISFAKGANNKLFIRLETYLERSTDSSIEGMYRSVHESTLDPIVAAFDIKTFTPDSSASVIDVTDFLNSDNPLLYFDAATKSKLSLGGYQKDKSYVESVRAYPINVELGVTNTYLKLDLPISIGINTSFVLLPTRPMQPRYYDKRVGYFTTAYANYDASTGSSVIQMIGRWRLEPKDEDKEKYLSGELVEPKKPIVYYIDPATPKKWIPYLIQGVNDWGKAFEKAGFKNAIYALEAPANDSTFSLYDARHNAIIYKASPLPNASGPQIIDPRTGEVLETHINWYHNVMQLVHDWYMVQASPNDPNARKMVFDDSLMGQLIRFVCAHEVGHTLGLRHNLGASSTVPTDSLRSKSYIDENGFCPSIMDYARFNYVAQPEDHFTEKELFPRIGVYDEWAIEWGYRWLPQLKTKDEEEAYMNRWIIERLKEDKRLCWWEGEVTPFSYVLDPRVQSEDLGDDAVKASYYGIQNLKHVVANLSNWAVEPNKDYGGLKRMYDQVYAQYFRYVMHVANNIGGLYWTEKKAGQEGPRLTFIPREHQRKSLQFLDQQLFNNTNWLYNKKLFGLISGYGNFSAANPQLAVIESLVTLSNYMNMTYAQMQQPLDAYSFDEFLTDFDKIIWRELFMARSISFERRVLQKVYTERLLKYGVDAGVDPALLPMRWYDCYPIFHKHMQAAIQLIDKALPNYKDEASRLHLIEVRQRLTQALNYDRFGGTKSAANYSSNGQPPSPAINEMPFLRQQFRVLSLKLNPDNDEPVLFNSFRNFECNFLKNISPNQK